MEDLKQAAIVKITTRVPARIHQHFHSLSNANGNSYNALVVEAMEKFLETQAISELLKTSHDDYWIRTVITPGNDFYTEVTLGSSYVGTDHITMINVPVNCLDNVIRQFELLIPTVDKILESL